MSAKEPRHYVFLGLSITSTWGNGHATTYRGLLKELARLGHTVTFLERDVPWYSANREFDTLPYCTVALYSSLDELRDRFGRLLASADAVVIGSYVPDGVAIGHWVQSVAKNVCAFYDIDTPVTLTHVKEGRCEYLSAELIPRYDLYLSFTGGPTLAHIERELGSPCARPLYCSVDPDLYFPQSVEKRWTCAYLGTYAADRQPALQRLLLDVATSIPEVRFAVAGPQYPPDIAWPRNVDRIEHLPAVRHVEFYNAQSFALNITRQDMVRSGYSPSVRLFEAAACGVPILTDEWPGLASFFQPGREILPVGSSADVTACLTMPDSERHALAERARQRVLRFHTAAVRAREFEKHVNASLNRIAWSNQVRTAVNTPAVLT